MSQDYKNCLTASIPYLSEDSLFVDVGCNINPIVECRNKIWVENWNDDFTYLVFDYFPNSKCIGIEPIHLEAYEARWKNDDRVDIFKTALSNEEKVETFYYPGDRHVLTSIFLQDDFYQNNEKINEIEIYCTTLDNFCKKQNIKFIDYLKLDTEGSELKILEGSRELLKSNRVKFIQFEYGLYHKLMPNVDEICDFLKLYGYEELITSNREKLWYKI